MNVIPCSLEGLLILEPKVFGDARGFFMETWNQRRYQEAGITASFVQDNVSVSRRGALRGLHYQNPEFYFPKEEMTIRWDDPDIGIRSPAMEPTLSEKDAKGLRLREVPK